MSVAFQKAITGANNLIDQVNGHEEEEPVRKLDEIAKAITTLDQLVTDGLDDTEVQKIKECQKSLQGLSKKVREKVSFEHECIRKKDAPTWLARNDGMGLTYLGKGLSLINLALRYLRDMPILLGFNQIFSKSVELPQSVSGDLVSVIRLHEKVSSFLRSSAPEEFSRYLRHKGVDLKYCPDFDYGLSDGTTNSARKIVREGLESSNERFVAFPIVLPHGKFSIIDHIVLIFIDRTEHTVEYFDPKGVTSEHSFLKEGASISDVLDECKLALGDNYLIKENSNTHQLCSNDCGVFLEKYLYERTVSSKDCDTIFQSEISDSEIVDFRKQSISFFKDLANADHVDPKFHVNQPHSAEEIISFDDNDPTFS